MIAMGKTYAEVGMILGITTNSEESHEKNLQHARRIEPHAGRLEIAAAPGEGTALTGRVPLIISDVLQHNTGDRHGGGSSH
jgi:hypothetical protein